MYGILDKDGPDGVLIARFAAPISVVSNQPVFVSDTLSLKRRGSKRNAQRWEIETRVMPMRDDANTLMSHLILNGPTEPHYIRMPQNYGVIMQRIESTSEAHATGAKYSDVLTISNSNGFIPKGTFISFEFGKVYMTCSDRQGNGAVQIYPPLRAAVSSADAFHYMDDVILWAWVDTTVVRGMSYTDGVLMDPGVLKFVERV
jgi:hypothetical protein